MAKIRRGESQAHGNAKVKFAIYHNIPKAGPIKIHYIDCHYYKNRKQPQAENSDWHTASTLKEARDTAEKLARKYDMRWRHCKTCWNRHSK